MKEAIEELIKKYQSEESEILIGGDKNDRFENGYETGVLNTLVEVIDDLTNLLKQNQ